MKVEPPQVLLDAIARFDARADIFDCGKVMIDANTAIDGLEHPNDDARKSAWAECAPWEFRTHSTDDGGPWNTYFQPLMMLTATGGGTVTRPNLQTATPEIIEYWGKRAEESKHPVLKARYADLVWDTAKFVTGKKPNPKFARMAIDAYLLSAHEYSGDQPIKMREGLTRALQLSLKFQDQSRIDAAVNATVAFVEKTARDDQLGTYCYLYDNLLGSDKGPHISTGTEQRVIDFLEAKFAIMTTPGGGWDAEPHSPEDVGLRLAAYYTRKKSEAERIRVLRAIAQAFERRAAKISPLIGMHDLHRAGELYVIAGLRGEAERVRRQGQEIGPKAVESMEVIETSTEIPKAVVDEFKGILTKLGLPKAITWLTVHFIPRQSDLAQFADEMAKEYPLHAMFKPQLLKDDRIAADMGDVDGDPDGEAVYRTSQRLQLDQVWLGWGLDHLFETMHLTVDQAVAFISNCPLYQENRLAIIRAGLQAHIEKDYLKSVHVLVPQIEKALVNLLYQTGGATIKPYRSGRGVMQQKNLNDVLLDPENSRANACTLKALGPDLRIYLIAALSHEKGLNIRNEVCHGLRSTDYFTKTTSERVLHALFAVSLLGKVEPTTEGAEVPRGTEPPENKSNT
jgi:hypothetical protein